MKQHDTAMLCAGDTAPHIAARMRTLPRQLVLLRVADAVIVIYVRLFSLLPSQTG